MSEALTQLGVKTFPLRFYVYMVLYGGMWLILAPITVVLFPLLHGLSFFIGAMWVVGIMLAFDIWRYAEERLANE